MPAGNSRKPVCRVGEVVATSLDQSESEMLCKVRRSDGQLANKCVEFKSRNQRQKEYNDLREDLSYFGRRSKNIDKERYQEK